MHRSGPCKYCDSRGADLVYTGNAGAMLRCVGRKTTLWDMADMQLHCQSPPVLMHESPALLSSYSLVS